MKPEPTGKNSGTSNKQRTDIEAWFIDKQDILIGLHISSSTLKRWRKKKLLSTYRLGGKIWYDKHELERLIRSTVINAVDQESQVRKMK